MEDFKGIDFTMVGAWLIRFIVNRTQQAQENKVFILLNFLRLEN
jgi:hypothetical protein